MRWRPLSSQMWELWTVSSHSVHHWASELHTLALYWRTGIAVKRTVLALPSACLEIISCGCTSKTLCQSKMCRCQKAELLCTKLCSCKYFRFNSTRVSLMANLAKIQTETPWLLSARMVYKKLIRRCLLSAHTKTSGISFPINFP